MSHPNVIEMLREAARALRRHNGGAVAGAQAEALAEVLLHEARWAEEDPDYAWWPEPLPVAAARIVLGPRGACPARASLYVNVDDEPAVAGQVTRAPGLVARSGAATLT